MTPVTIYFPNSSPLPENHYFSHCKTKQKNTHQPPPINPPSLGQWLDIPPTLAYPPRLLHRLLSQKLKFRGNSFPIVRINLPFTMDLNKIIPRLWLIAWCPGSYPRGLLYAWWKWSEHKGDRVLFSKFFLKTASIVLRVYACVWVVPPCFGNQDEESLSGEWVHNKRNSALILPSNVISWLWRSNGEARVYCNNSEERRPVPCDGIFLRTFVLGIVPALWHLRYGEVSVRVAGNRDQGVLRSQKKILCSSKHISNFVKFIMVFTAGGGTRVLLFRLLAKL